MSVSNSDGSRNSQTGTQTYYLANFFQKLHENEKEIDLGEGRYFENWKIVLKLKKLNILYVY